MYVQDLAGGTPRPVTPEGVAERDDTLTLDGKWVAARQKGEFMRFPVDGGEPQPIVRSQSRGQAAALERGRPRPLRAAGQLPAKIFALDVTTGQRTLVRNRSARHGRVDAVADTRLTPDGKSYAYVYIRSLYSLYQVTGLQVALRSKTEPNAHSRPDRLLEELILQEPRIARQLLLVEAALDIGAARVVVGLIDDDLDALLVLEAVPRTPWAWFNRLSTLRPNVRRLFPPSGQHVLHADVGL